MRHAISLLSAILAFALAAVPVSRADENVPPDIAAKRSGKVKQAEPSPAEMVYVPIAPCRALGGQTIATNQIRTFLISGSASMAAQGGPATGCGVPTYAKAVSINLSSGTSTAQGYLTAYAAGTARPNLASLNYRTYPATTGSIVGLGAGGQISVLATAATRVSGDITGYYAPQLWAYVNSNGTVVDASPRVTGATKLSTGQYRVDFDRDVADCGVTSQSDFQPRIATGYSSGNSVYVYIWSVSGSPADYFFFVQVKC